jgi:hypothetical protein
VHKVRRNSNHAERFKAKCRNSTCTIYQDALALCIVVHCRYVAVQAARAHQAKRTPKLSPRVAGIPTARACQNDRHQAASVGSAGLTG